MTEFQLHIISLILMVTMLNTCTINDNLREMKYELKRIERGTK